jgi:hypothetical protein
MIPNRSALFALAALALPAGAQAQHVSADITIASGPVAGRVILGGPDYERFYHRRPSYREVVVVREHRGRGWYHRHGLRPVRVYYDSDRDCWYDRPYYRGLRAVIVYADRDRYFYDGDWDRDRGYYSWHDDDRYYGGRRYDDRRYDDRRYDDRRTDGRYDERNDYRRRVDDRRGHDDGDRR